MPKHEMRNKNGLVNHMMSKGLAFGALVPVVHGNDGFCWSNCSSHSRNGRCGKIFYVPSGEVFDLTWDGIFLW